MRRNLLHKLVRQAVRVLRSGGVVIYPTETSYALGCDAQKAHAVAQIFKLKGRSKTKQLPVITASRAMAERFFILGANARRLAQRYWPGPLTIVLKPRKTLPVSYKGGVAVRVSGHPVAQQLSRALKAPLVSTSANISGKPACFSVTALKKQFGARLKNMFVIDIGALPRRKPSTIVAISEVGEIQVVRQGAIKIN